MVVGILLEDGCVVLYCEGEVVVGIGEVMRVEWVMWMDRVESDGGG